MLPIIRIFLIQTVLQGQMIAVADVWGDQQKNISLFLASLLNQMESITKE